MALKERGRAKAVKEVAICGDPGHWKNECPRSNGKGGESVFSLCTLRQGQAQPKSDALITKNSFAELAETVDPESDLETLVPGLQPTKDSDQDLGDGCHECSACCNRADADLMPPLTDSESDREEVKEWRSAKTINKKKKGHRWNRLMTLPFSNGARESRPAREAPIAPPVASASGPLGDREQVGIIREITVGSMNSVEEAPEWEALDLTVDSGASVTVIGREMVKAVEAREQGLTSSTRWQTDLRSNTSEKRRLPRSLTAAQNNT